MINGNENENEKFDDNLYLWHVIDILIETQHSLRHGQWIPVNR